MGLRRTSCFTPLLDDMMMPIYASDASKFEVKFLTFTALNILLLLLSLYTYIVIDDCIFVLRYMGINV